MEIAGLRHRGTIQRLAPTRGALGGEQQGWVDVTKVWAEVKALTGRETNVDPQTIATADYQVRIRYRSGIEPKMRYVEGDLVLDILAPMDRDGRRQWLYLLCQEVKTDAGTDKGDN